MKILLSAIVLTTLIGCSWDNKNSPPELYKFNIYDMEDLDFSLGLFDTVYTEVEHYKYSTAVRVKFNGNYNSLTKECWEGTINIREDSIFFNVKYVYKKDPLAGWWFYDANTIVYEYLMTKVDTNYYKLVLPVVYWSPVPHSKKLIIGRGNF